MTTAALNVVSLGANIVWVMVVVVNPLYQKRESSLVPICPHPVQFLHKTQIEAFVIVQYRKYRVYFLSVHPPTPTKNCRQRRQNILKTACVEVLFLVKRDISCVSHLFPSIRCPISSVCCLVKYCSAMDRRDHNSI